MSLSKGRSSLLRRLHSSRTRMREGLVLAEGAKVIEEAVLGGHAPRFVVRVEGAPSAVRSPLPGGLDPDQVELHEVDAATFATLSATEGPQGLLAVFEEPSSLKPADWGRPRRVLILDAIQDPGNVGTLMRSAWAFGVELVVALDGTADPWSPKVVRASAGSIFRVSVQRARWDETVRWLGDVGLPLLVGAADGMPVGGIRQPKWALVVGNEAAGVRDDVLSTAHDRVAVAMTGKVDSLNVAVAGSILMHALSMGSDEGAQLTSTEETK